MSGSSQGCDGVFRIAAPADVVYAAAGEMRLGQLRIVRAILGARELIFGSSLSGRISPSGLVAQTKALGWGLLAEVPGREIVLGAITQPWPLMSYFALQNPRSLRTIGNPVT